MTAQHDPSVDELRLQSERSRAALTSTVGELRDKVSDTADDLKTRLSPAHIKEEVKDYVREGSEQFFKSIERKARANPLQAVAIGAGLAYPLWGLFKTIPVPLMLVGAGLLLSKQKTALGSYAQGMAAAATEASSIGAERITESAHQVGASMASGADFVTDKLRATAHDVRDSVADASGAIAAAVKDKSAVASDAIAAAAGTLRDKTVEFGAQSRTAFEDLIHRNPLLMGGMALAAGAFIAASLPASNVENQIFGDRSDEVKNRGRELAARGVERSKQLASNIVGDVAAAADREGLTPEGLAKVVDDVTHGVKSVMNKGLDAALGETSTALSSPSQKLSNGDLQ